MSSIKQHLQPGRLGRHLGLQFVQMVMETGCRTLTIFIVAWLFQVKLFGQLGILLAVVHFLYMMADGAWGAMVKFIAEAKAKDVSLGVETGWRLALWTIALATGAGLILMIAAALLFNRGGEFPPLYFILAWLLGVATIAKVSFETAFRGLKHFGPPAKWGIALAPIQTAALIAAAWQGYRINAYMTIMIVAAGINAIALAIQFLRIWRVPHKADPATLEQSTHRIREAMLYSRPLILRGIVMFFFLKVNILIVAWFRGDIEAGYMTFADRFLLLPLLAIGAYLNAIMPRIAERTADGRADKIQEYVGKSMTMMTIGMLPFAVVFFAAGPLINRFLPEYAPAVPLIMLLGPFLFIKAWSGLATTGLLLPAGFATQTLWLTTAGSAGNLALNCILTPIYGVWGCVAGMVVVHTIVAFAAMIVASRKMGVCFRFGRI